MSVEHHFRTSASAGCAELAELHHQPPVCSKEHRREVEKVQGRFRGHSTTEVSAEAFEKLVHAAQRALAQDWLPHELRMIVHSAATSLGINPSSETRDRAVREAIRRQRESPMHWTTAT